MTTSASASESEASGFLSAGRAALASHAWREAYELLEAAERESPLSGPDLEGFAEAAFFAAKADRETAIKERAYQAYLAGGDPQRAAYVAIDIGRDYSYAGKASVGSAWVRRGEHLLADLPESYVNGYLAVVQSEAASSTGDVDTALALAQRAVDIGTRTTDTDLHAQALTNLGGLQIAMGDTTAGITLMEEASIAAVNGELSPFTTGVTCCRMIAALRDLSDYGRASEWTEQTERWCEQRSVSGFPGVCRIHRAEVVAISGEWARAEQELERATGELAAYNAIPPLADGFYALGDIKRLRGDYEGAEAALRQAHGLGRTPQPALALVRLAEGKVKAAAAAIASAIEEQTWDQWARARLLPAQVEIAIAAGDPVLARQAAEELTKIVQTYPSPALEAGRRMAWGRVLLAEGDAASAVHELRAAAREWRTVGAPYEVARTRAIIARALRALDDDDAADLEIEAARDEFQRLGARLDVAAADRDIRDARERSAPAVQVRRTFMFTDIVGSTELASGLGNEAWERLLAQHDAVLRARIDAERGRDRQLDRRWLLRRVRVGPFGCRVRDIDPAVPGEAPPRHRRTALGPDRSACRRGEPPWLRLQRAWREHRRASCGQRRR